MLKIVLATLPAIYILFIIFAVFLIHFVTVKRRKLLLREKFPLEKDLKVLREPGESQRKFVDELFEKLFGRAIVGAVTVFELAILPVQLIVWLKLDHRAQLEMLLLSATLMVVSSILLIAWLLRSLNEIRNRQLGWFGERVVGEYLNKLKASGFFVFHDIPVGDSKLRHNIDHVVVGSTGLFVIETKTYRKRKGRPGLEDHKIIFTGDRLIFPWADSRDELVQVHNQAKRLSDRLSEKLKQRFEIQPILAFPGWWIESDIDWPIALNHKRLCSYILHKRTSPLHKEQITAAAEFLDSVCRDVEY